MIKSFQNLVLAIALIIVGTLISPSVAQAGELGGIDMDRYCTSVGQVRAELIGGRTPFDWRCIDNDNRYVSIDVNSACRGQYGPRAVGRLNNVNDASSWVCTND
jgi:hypothetical protein